jgi:cardiolipin synthase
MSVRTPQGSIAWAVSLIALPYISVPAYWVFGRNKFNGYILARKHELKFLEDIVRQANDEVKSVAEFDRRQSGVLTGAEKWPEFR